MSDPKNSAPPFHDADAPRLAESFLFAAKRIQGKLEFFETGNEVAAIFMLPEFWRAAAKSSEDAREFVEEFLPRYRKWRGQKERKARWN